MGLKTMLRFKKKSKSPSHDGSTIPNKNKKRRSSWSFSTSKSRANPQDPTAAPVIDKANQRVSMNTQKTETSHASAPFVVTNHNQDINVDLNMRSFTPIAEMMDFPSIPFNINVENRDPRFRGMSSLKNHSTQFSTFSLLSEPTFKRDELAENNDNNNAHSDPYLWEYDQDVYTSYDIDQEIGNRSLCGTKVSLLDDEELSFFAANPLPGLHGAPFLTLQNNNNTRRSSRRLLMAQQPHQHSSQLLLAHRQVTDLPAGDPTLATADVTRELVKKFVSEIWNRGDVDMIPQICSPKIRFNGSGDTLAKVGHDGFASMVQEIHRAFSGYHTEIHSMVCEGNKAFCRLRFSGRHVGRLMGYPGTGQLMHWNGATEFTCVDGVILKVWELVDVSTLVEQLEEESLNRAISGVPQEQEDCGWGS